DRITIVREWLDQINKTSTPLTLQNTLVMIYPFTGGLYQDLILANYPITFKFYTANDPALTNALDYLQGQQYINLTLAKSNYIYRYQNYTMGTSSPGHQLMPLHDVLNQDFHDVNAKGLLPFTEYRFIHLSDGMWTPLKTQIQLVLSTFAQCTSCATDPTKCQ